MSEYEDDPHFKIRRATLCANPYCNRGLCKDKTRSVNFCCLVCEKKHFGEPTEAKHGSLCLREKVDEDADRAKPIPVKKALVAADFPYSGYRGTLAGIVGYRGTGKGIARGSKGHLRTGPGRESSSAVPPPKRQRLEANPPPPQRREAKPPPPQRRVENKIENATSSDAQDKTKEMWEACQTVFPLNEPLRKAMFNYITRAYKTQMQNQWGSNKAAMKEFVEAWIDDTIRRYLQAYGTQTLTEQLQFDDAKDLFQMCLHAGMAPRHILANIGAPPMGWPYVAKVLETVYPESSRSLESIQSKRVARSQPASQRDASAASRPAARRSEPASRTRSARAPSTTSASARRPVQSQPSDGEGEVIEIPDDVKDEEEEEDDFPADNGLVPLRTAEDEDDEEMAELAEEAAEFQEGDCEAQDEEEEGEVDDGEEDLSEDLPPVEANQKGGHPDCDSGDVCTGNPRLPVGPLRSGVYSGKYCENCRAILES